MEEVYIGFAVLAFILAVGFIQMARDSAILDTRNKKLIKNYFIELSREIESPRYFTTGHPYVWVEATLKEILEKFHGIPPSKLSGIFQASCRVSC